MSCPETKIFFEKTNMFTERIYNFSVKNETLLSLAYRWQFINLQTGLEDSGYFKIRSSSGTMQPKLN